MAEKDPEKVRDSSQGSVDNTVHTEDHMDKLFKAIDWDSRAKKTRSDQRWLEPETWSSLSYTMKYLNYQLEEGKVDLTNPFHIEEGNQIRSRLERKKGRKVCTENDFTSLV